ncbi:MAG: hypothetical protein K2L22_09015 [Muribaculaceae bacterium]|nr:hypothetical protein [Muribaculaceae bacterium]
MKKNLLEELGMTADKVILTEKDMLCVKGGWDIPIEIGNGYDCFKPHLNLSKCVTDSECYGNYCDLKNVGGCPGNTVIHGVCPTSN